MIYIIIPVFNRLEHTIKCLESLDKQRYREYKIVLVDDGSTDGTYKYISKEFPSVSIVQGDGSWWWSKSTNRGIESILDKSAEDDLILTLNNDLTLYPDYLENLLKIYYEHKPCLVGSISVWKNDIDKIEFVGVKWNAFNASYKSVAEKEMKYQELKKQKTHISTDLLPGRGTLYPVELIKEIGLYDDVNFPQYAADEDFSLRAKNAGHKLVVAVDAVVVSDVESTGINFRYDRPSFRKFVNSLGSIRSANNLKVRYQFAKKHARVTIVYFFCDLFRIFGSFFKRYLKSIIKKY